MDAARSGMVAALGEILVEIGATTRGDGFRAAQPLVGPFPSGAPAIFIDQVARLGQPAGLIGSVGDDDFGRVNLDRLRADGVDVSAVQVLPDQVTGSAFVRYREDGERDFVFNLRHSAAGRTRITAAAEALLGRSCHLHLMGSSLFSPELIEAAGAAVARVKAVRGTVSFDPNVRPEMLRAPGMAQAMQRMLLACDLFLPSGAELTLLTGAASEPAAIEQLLARGIQAIVVKRGAEGASYHDRDQAIHAPALRVLEVDPTGAGDCFGATFVTCRLRGRAPAESLRFACAAGAHAVGARGPMEGAAGFAQLEALMRAAS